MSKAIMQQALDALEKLSEQSDCDIDPFTFGRYGGNLAIQALRTELAKPEPEPVGEIQAYNDYGYPWKRISGYEFAIADMPIGAKVYSAPTEPNCRFPVCHSQEYQEKLADEITKEQL